jgi:multiple sugar transport system substrate-binding protein
MTMKKRVAFAVSLALFAAALGACSTSGNDSQAPADEPAPADNPQPSENDGKTAETPSEQVVVTYANWNLGTAEENNIERKMIAAFEESHPNIKVQIDEGMDYSKYGESLSAAAAAGKLPDVIMLPNIEFGLANEWLADITPYTDTDAEWNNIPKPLENATHFGQGIYAVPAGMFFMGYFVNSDLFEQANAPELPFSPTWDQFVESVKTLNNPSEGIVGLSEEVQIPEWYPASVNSNFGWYTWDGEKYNLNDASFIDGVNKAKDLFKSGYVYDSLSEEQKAQYNAGWFGDVWNQGKIAVRWDGTWATKDYGNLNFKSRFVGVPGGRFTVVGDFLGVSKSAASTEAAYEFAKFMSFGKDGILKRMELNTDGSYTSLPLTTDQTILDQYFATNTYEGLKEAFDVVNNGILEGVKVVPGYVKSRWEAPTGVKVGDKDNANLSDLIFNSFRGDVKIEDYAEQINKLANDEHAKAAAAISALTE